MIFPMIKLRHFFVTMFARFRHRELSAARLSEPLHKRAPAPESSQEAHASLRSILDHSDRIDELNDEEFIRGWVAMAYIAPGLNPDEASTDEGGWPLSWRPIAAEAFLRFADKRLTNKELYPRPTRF